MVDVTKPRLIPGPGPIDDVGYTCQTYLNHYLTHTWFKGVYYVYFSKELNPVGNGDSANPLVIYQWYDRAIKSRDENHPKVRYHRTNLLWIIDEKRRNGVIDEVTASNLSREVANAPMSLFRPEIWRINLDMISTNRIQKTNNFPDEYVIADLLPSEFDVIIS